MKNNKILPKIIDILSFSQKWKLVLLIISMIISALMEMIGVGLIMPFIAILNSPDILTSNKIAYWFYNFTNSDSREEFIIICSIALISFYLAKNLFMGLIIYFQSDFLAKFEANICSSLLSKYLSMPYLKHISRNTSDIVNNITMETSLVFSSLIKPVFFILSDIFVLISIIGLLVFLAPFATMLTFAILIFSVTVFYITLSKPLKNLGASRQYHRQKMIQWVNQSLGSIKEITVLNRKEYFQNSFNDHASKMIKPQTFYEVASQMPWIVIESIGVIMVITIMLILVAKGGDFIPTLSIFAMAAFRLMPSLKRLTACATKVRFHTKSLNSVHTDLFKIKSHKTFSENKQLNFTKEISLKNISFKYPKTQKFILNNISLTIKKGISIGIIGPSGEGKSTLIDVILGLLPTNGEILVDGVNIKENIPSWYKNISYMPQSVYLTDDTIKRNIAFGIKDEDIDEKLVWESLKKAELDKLVKAYPDGINTMVGEQGTKLSGGQRQRIGIARAFYNKPKILILDEATSSLDPATEQKICNTLKSLCNEVTIIAISHQPALIGITDEVYTLKDGKISLGKKPV